MYFTTMHTTIYSEEFFSSFNKLNMSWAKKIFLGGGGGGHGPPDELKPAVPGKLSDRQTAFKIDNYGKDIALVMRYLS